MNGRTKCSVRKCNVTKQQKGFRQNHTQFAADIGLDEKLKDQSGALHSPFPLIDTRKALNGKLTV